MLIGCGKENGQQSPEVLVYRTIISTETMLSLVYTKNNCCGEHIYIGKSAFNNLEQRTLE